MTPLTPPPPTVQILGVPVHGVTLAETLQQINRWLYEPGLHQIATINPEFVMRAQTDVAFRAVLRQAALCLPDGIGVLYAARWLGRPLPERVAGAELVYHMAALAAREKQPLFLLGAAPGVAAQAGAILQQRYPGLIVAGSYAGSPALDENTDLVERINASGATLLYVAYGAPAQDLWIARNRTALTQVRVAIGVGGAFDFITGRARRAPIWVQRLHLEWLHRLLHEPWRWRRMLALPRFVWAVVWYGRRATS